MASREFNDPTITLHLDGGEESTLLPFASEVSALIAVVKSKCYAAVDRVLQLDCVLEWLMCGSPVSVGVTYCRV